MRKLLRRRSRSSATRAGEPCKQSTRRPPRRNVRRTNRSRPWGASPPTLLNKLRPPRLLARKHRPYPSSNEIQDRRSNARLTRCGDSPKQLYHKTRQSLDQTCQNSTEQAAKVIQACEESKRLAEQKRHLAHELATKTEMARQTVQSSEEMVKRANEHTAEAVIACEESRN